MDLGILSGMKFKGSGGGSVEILPTKNLSWLNRFCWLVGWLIGLVEGWFCCVLLVG